MDRFKFKPISVEVSPEQIIERQRWLEIFQKLPVMGGFGTGQFKEIVRHDRWDKRFVNCIIFINAAKP